MLPVSVYKYFCGLVGEETVVRQEAVFPLSWVAANKFWPSVNRIDDVYGDRNLFCACAPISDYQ